MRAPDAPSPELPLMSERRVSLIGALLVAIGPVSMALYTPAMTALVEAFGTSESVIKLTLTLYFGGFATAQLVAGPISDALGRRPVTVAFMLIYCVASVVALFAPTVGVLMAARFMQGIGASAGVAIARAIVRDLFTGDRSSRIMNLIGIILSVGPALAPTIGGVMLVAIGWRSIFVAMLAFGLIVILVALFAMRETVEADLTRLKPRQLAGSYLMLLGHRHFLTTTMVLAGAIGAIYAQATFLPFILIGRVGLTPAEFGLSMLLQSGSFFAGSLVVRALMARMSAYRMVPIGLALVALGSVGTAGLLVWDPTLLRVMVPVGIYAVGIAFVMPAMSTAALAPFRRDAGAAAAMMGFLQMGAGLLVGSLGALFGDTVLAMACLIPGMGTIACLAYIVYLRSPRLGEIGPRKDIIAAPQQGRTMMPD